MVLIRGIIQLLISLGVTMSSCFESLREGEFFRLEQDYLNVHKKIPVQFFGIGYEGEFKPLTFVNTIRLTDDQLSGCGPKVPVIKLRKKELWQQATEQYS